jgi:ADP-ribose pyrophosphatase
MSEQNDIRGLWRVLTERVCEDFQILKVLRSRRSHTRRDVTIDFLKIEGRDWVTVLPITADNRVILVKQYRHGAEKFTLEIPGGIVDPEEDPKTSGLRELAEETGYVADDAEHLRTFLPNAASLSIQCHTYVAYNVRRDRTQQLDHGEDIEVVELSMTEFIDAALHGAFEQGIGLATIAIWMLKERERFGLRLPA